FQWGCPPRPVATAPPPCGQTDRTVNFQIVVDAELQERFDTVQWDLSKECIEAGSSSRTHAGLRVYTGAARNIVTEPFGGEQSFGQISSSSRAAPREISFGITAAQQGNWCMLVDAVVAGQHLRVGEVGIKIDTNSPPTPLTFTVKRSLTGGLFVAPPPQTFGGCPRP